MKVKQLAAAANDYEWISVEDDDYNVFAFDEAKDIKNNKEVANKEIDCFLVGNRENRNCVIVIVK